MSEWVPAFPGQRRPFLPGNEMHTTHGAYASVLHLTGAAETRAAEIRSACPAYSPADEFTVRALSIILERVDRASAALSQFDEIVDAGRGGPLGAYAGEAGKKLDTLRADLRGWLYAAERYFSALGMTPSSRARLGLDVALAVRVADQALDRLTAEGRRVRESREERS